MIFSVASLQAQTKVGDVPKLLEDLNSTDPALRGSAAAALDNLHDPAAVSMLVSALRHSHNASATPVLVRILGRFDDANAVAAIADLLSTDAGVIASQQLLQMGERGTQAVVGALASDDERTRANVSEAFKSDPDLTLKVLPAVLRTSKSAMQREQIVGVLADSVAQNPSYEDPPRASFVEGFLPGASDAVPSVRIAVASAVQQLAEMEKELADSRFGPPDFALGRALPALQSLAEDRDSAVRVAAVDALGAMGRADAISILKKHVHDPDPTVREHVETAVAAGEHTPLPASSSQPAAKNAELRATTNDNAEVHRLALIKEWNDEAAIPKLVPLLHDPSSLVRAAAADKLGQLDYRATAMSGEDHQQNLSEVPALIRALKDPHALVRAAERKLSARSATKERQVISPTH